MSAPQHVTARLKFLDEAAKLIWRDIPATSARLEAEHDCLTRELNIKLGPSIKRTEEICNACGNIFKPGKSCDVTVVRGGQAVNKSITKHEKQKEKKHRAQAQARRASTGQRMLIYSCDRCRRQTKFNLESAPKSKQSAIKNIARSTTTIVTNAAAIQDIPHTSVGESLPDKKHHPNASSKHRARARKQGSLQAMLVKSKAETAMAKTDTSFGLMDFMVQN